MLHDLSNRHVFVSVIGRSDGSMCYSITCPCGCFAFSDTLINPGDTVKAFKSVHIIGKIRDLTIIALEINARSAELNNCKIKAPNEAIEQYCGSRLI